MYWPYWGEVQNFLNPALDSKRISRETLNLKAFYQEGLSVVKRDTRKIEQLVVGFVLILVKKLKKLMINNG